MSAWRVILRPLCWVFGHRNAMLSLPEDRFGLYAFSRLYCSRCELTFIDRYIV